MADFTNNKNNLTASLVVQLHFLIIFGTIATIEGSFVIIQVCAHTIDVGIPPYHTQLIYFLLSPGLSERSKPAPPHRYIFLAARPPFLLLSLLLRLPLLSSTIFLVNFTYNSQPIPPANHPPWLDSGCERRKRR